MDRFFMLSVFAYFCFTGVSNAMVTIEIARAATRLYSSSGAETMFQQEFDDFCVAWLEFPVNSADYLVFSQIVGHSNSYAGILCAAVTGIFSIPTFTAEDLESWCKANHTSNLAKGIENKYIANSFRMVEENTTIATKVIRKFGIGLFLFEQHLQDLTQFLKIQSDATLFNKIAEFTDRQGEGLTTYLALITALKARYTLTINPVKLTGWMKKNSGHPLTTGIQNKLT